MAKLFAVRLIHHLIAECKSLHPVPPVTRPRVPHASEVERAFTGTFTRIAPKSFHPFPLDGICHPLCAIMASACDSQTVGLSLSPCLRSSALDRIAGLLALETSALQRQPLSVGLLDEASIEHGQATLVASGSTSRHLGGWFNPASFHLVGSQTTPADAVHPNNVS